MEIYDFLKRLENNKMLADRIEAIITYVKKNSPANYKVARIEKVMLKIPNLFYNWNSFRGVIRNMAEKEILIYGRSVIYPYCYVDKGKNFDLADDFFIKKKEREESEKCLFIAQEERKEAT